MIAVNKDNCQISGDVIGVTEDLMNIVLSLSEMFGEDKAKMMVDFVSTMNSKELFEMK